MQGIVGGIDEITTASIPIILYGMVPAPALRYAVVVARYAIVMRYAVAPGEGW